jgi:hypothetical protein
MHGQVNRRFPSWATTSCSPCRRWNWEALRQWAQPVELGAFKESGIEGLRFRCVHDDRWAPPDPTGLDCHFEGLYPPDVEDTRESVNIFVERKFGPAGAYAPNTFTTMELSSYVQAVHLDTDGREHVRRSRVHT